MIYFADDLRMINLDDTSDETASVIGVILDASHSVVHQPSACLNDHSPGLTVSLLPKSMIISRDRIMLRQFGDVSN